MAWFAVRSVYLTNRKQSGGANVFEERIVAIEAENEDQAFEKAEEESARYADYHHFDAHDEMRMYTQDGDALIDGYELWSQLYESREDLDTFYKRRYDQYQYHPE